MADEGVTPRSTDYGRWYLDVIREAELADYGPVRGTMIIRPYGYAIWENIQHALDRRFKETGHLNAYFPLFIPHSFIQKEKQHVEGFSPELALVTVGGGKELEEPLVVRPTSETIINHMFTQWIKSYRDLPMLLNQWANVVRWEMRTRPFLRTLEFLWQEGHTAHATYEEAEAEARRMVNIYRDFAENEAAVPVIAGRKSRLETFAGAVHSYTIEAMMGDMRALQSGTSHNLGDNFARAFGTQFLDESNELHYISQTSWGLSTRFVGAVIMVHGDDKGLALPPRLAPIQVIIVPIWRAEGEKTGVIDAARGLCAQLSDAGIRASIDSTDQRTPGWKFNFWEMKGVPVRIELGPRDLEKGTVVLARRDLPGREGKTLGVARDAAADRVLAMLGEVQSSLFERARGFLGANIHDVSSYDELRDVISQGGWARGWWAGSDEDELKVKEETGATIRCFPFEQPQGPGACIMTGKEAREVAAFAKAY
jgi:prolyl-tRNA synthetase